MHHLRVFGTHGQKPGPLSQSFEQVMAKLEALPRMFVELDGSFVWRHTTAWDGEVMDAGGRVQYIELRAPGDEDPSETRQSLGELMQCFGVESEEILIELVREGGVVTKDAFFEKLMK